MPAYTGSPVGGLGRGMMQGLELHRQHSREDEEAERQRERDELAREQAELGMRSTRQQIDQRGDLHPLRVENQRLGLQQTEGQLEHRENMRPLEVAGARQGVQIGQNRLNQQEVEARAREQAEEANVAVRALLMGDTAAVEGWYNSIAPNEMEMNVAGTDPETGQPVYDIAYSDGDNERVGHQEMLQRIGGLSNPQAIVEQVMSGGGQNPLQASSHADLRAEYDRLYGPPTDAEVQMAWQSGDEDAMRELRERYQNRPSFREFASSYGVQIPDPNGQGGGGGNGGQGGIGPEEATNALFRLAQAGELTTEEWDWFQASYPDRAPQVQQELQNLGAEIRPAGQQGGINRERTSRPAPGNGQGGAPAEGLQRQGGGQTEFPEWWDQLPPGETGY